MPTIKTLRNYAQATVDAHYKAQPLTIVIDRDNYAYVNLEQLADIINVIADKPPLTETGFQTILNAMSEDARDDLRIFNPQGLGKKAYLKLSSVLNDLFYSTQLKRSYELDDFVRWLSQVADVKHPTFA